MLAHILDLEEALAHLLYQDPIMLRDLNVDLDEAQNPHSQIIANLLTEFGLIDLIHHFQKSLCFNDLRMWTQALQGTVLRDRCNFILETDQRLFKVVGIRDMRNYSSYHFALR